MSASPPSGTDLSGTSPARGSCRSAAPIVHANDIILRENIFHLAIQARLLVDQLDGIEVSTWLSPRKSPVIPDAPTGTNGRRTHPG